MARVRQLMLGLASGSALYSGMAPALGLGDITLHSALNQPFEAEIELLEVGDLGAQDLRVGLAPAEVFSRSGVERLYFLNDLRFTPLLRGSRSVIRVVSSRPVREPYLNFIVEVAPQRSVAARIHRAARPARLIGLHLGGSAQCCSSLASDPACSGSSGTGQSGASTECHGRASSPSRARRQPLVHRCAFA